MIRARLARPLCALVLLLAVDMSVAEFVRVQQFTDYERRQRFGLPQTCAPALVAVRATRGMVHVLVTCNDDSDAEPPSAAGADLTPRRRPPGATP